MQLVKTSERTSRGGMSASFNQKVTVPVPEQVDPESVHEYGAMILTSGASRTGNNLSDNASQHGNTSTPRKTKISVDDIQSKNGSP